MVEPDFAVKVMRVFTAINDKNTIKRPISVPLIIFLPVSRKLGFAPAIIIITPPMMSKTGAIAKKARVIPKYTRCWPVCSMSHKLLQGSEY